MKNSQSRKIFDNPAVKGAPDICIDVIPGICGFKCVVKARKLANRKIGLQIFESECGQIKKLSANLQEMDWKDLFVPLSRNPVYVQAEKAGCHPSCVLPAAVLKAAEVALGMALSKDVYFKFQPCKGRPVHEQ